MSSEPRAPGPFREPPAYDVDVLVLGASFAGIELVYQLVRRTDGKPLRITVVDRQREHGYLPLVQERLSGRLDAAETRLQTAAFLESLPGVRFVAGEVVGLDPEKKVAKLAGGQEIGARFVVVTLGSVLAPPAAIAGGERLVVHKTEDEFARARAQLERALGRGATTPRVVVVGGGITGVELAAELAWLSGVKSPYEVAPKVTLVADTDRLVPVLTPAAGRKAMAALQSQGVEVLLRTSVTAVHEGRVTVRSDGGSRDLEHDLAFWAGGVRPAPILAELGLPRTDAGWLAVGPTLQCFPAPKPTQPDIFACGDAVRIQGGDGEWSTMQRAIECLWQAKLVAKNLLLLAREPADYSRGVPPLVPHVQRRTFAYGVSLGRRSLVVWGRVVLDVPGLNHWFRRWLMRKYFERYAPSAPAIAAPAAAALPKGAEPPRSESREPASER